MGAEFQITDQDRQILKLAAEQLWRKGAHNPDESAVAQALTNFVKRAFEWQSKDAPKKE